MSRARVGRFRRSCTTTSTTSCIRAIRSRVRSPVRSSDARVHLRLLDEQGTVVAEGASTGQGERLDVAKANLDAFYVLDVTRRDRDPQAPSLALRWESVQPVRTTDNLSRVALNGNARLDSSWRAAVANGRVKARFGASFGGPLPQDVASARLTFLDAKGRRVGRIAVTSPVELARGGNVPIPQGFGDVAGLPVATSDYVPKNAVAMRLDLTFKRGAKRTAGKADADAIELVLAEFSMTR